MKERLAKSMARPATDFKVFTFHGFCNTWLRQEGHRIGLPRYRILDPDETKGVIWDCAKNTKLGGWMYNQWVKTQTITGKTNWAELEAKYLEAENKKYKIKKIKYVSSALTVLTSNPHMTYKTAAKLTADSADSIVFVESVLAKYYHEKKINNLLDFDDLELKGIELFKTFDVSSYYDEVMVDEIQDSSSTDLELLKLVAPHKNIVGVGDSKQAIYGFRGSSASNLSEYVDAFDAKIVNLTSNFRSDKAIIEVANNTMKNHPDQDMKSTSGNTGFVGYVEFNTQQEELAWLLGSIQSLTI